MITIRTCTTRSGIIEWEVPRQLEEKLRSLSASERERAELRIRKTLRRLTFLRACAENSRNAVISHQYIDTEIERASRRLFDICGDPGRALDMEVMSKLTWTPPYQIEQTADLLDPCEREIVRSRLQKGAGFYLLVLTLSEIEPEFAKGMTILNRHLRKAARNLGMLWRAEQAVRH
jgi:hypothetical protein